MYREKVLVLTGYGINCDLETQKAFKNAGAYAERVHLRDILDGRKNLKNYHILALPGGFSFGDDIASGKVLANMIKYNLTNEIEEFIASGKLIIGICNGFQVMVKAGLLPGFGDDYRTQSVTLTTNDSGKFEDRDVFLKNKSKKCIFTRGIDTIQLPVAHMEGKFVCKNDAILKKLYENDQIVFAYVDESGNELPKKYPHNYPAVPNGSTDNIAGICDETGRVFGMMPHPERKDVEVIFGEILKGEGAQIFENAVNYVEESFSR